MKILIEIENGTVTNVYCSEPEGVEVLVIDNSMEDLIETVIEHPEYSFLLNDKYEVY